MTDLDITMVGYAYGRAVGRALSDLPARNVARSALATYSTLLLDAAPGTGELRIGVAELAERSMVPPCELEAVMLELARLRVIVRDPRREGDAWFINPHLAWSGPLDARARFADLVPPPAVEPEQEA